MDETAQTGRAVVLLVEDNADHAELVSRCLEGEELGSRLFHVRDGEEALEFLEKRGRYGHGTESPMPALVLLDLRLPRLDGLSLLRRIKGSPLLRTIPVVVLSTSTADPDVRSASEAGANAYLAKPLNFEEFRRNLRTTARFWLQCNTVPRRESLAEVEDQ